jgi:hypothetical protein
MFDWIPMHVIDAPFQISLAAAGVFPESRLPYTPLSIPNHGGCLFAFLASDREKIRCESTLD